MFICKRERIARGEKIPTSFPLRSPERVTAGVEFFILLSLALFLVRTPEKEKQIIGWLHTRSFGLNRDFLYFILTLRNPNAMYIFERLGGIILLLVKIMLSIVFSFNLLLALYLLTCKIKDLKSHCHLIGKLHHEKNN